MSIAEKLTTVAQNMDKVYESGYTSGYENGKQAGRDLIWDNFQQKGYREDYGSAFRTSWWTDDTFFPIHDMKASIISYAFQGSVITDLKDKLDAQGVTLDTSACTNFTSVFQGSKITHIPPLDMQKAKSLTYAFQGASVITIDKLIVVETTIFGNIQFPSALQNITLEGTIGTTISLQNSLNLTLASAKSILTHLKNFTGTGKEHTFSITLHANTWALLDADGNTAPDGSTWREYVQSTLCWNI